MDEAHKELVKRLRDDHFGWVPEYAKQAATALEALAGERDRLKAALEAIAVKAGTSECGGNYVAAVSLIGDLEQMADAALRAAGDGR